MNLFTQTITNIKAKFNNTPDLSMLDSPTSVKAKNETQTSSSSLFSSDVFERKGVDDGVLKAYIPKFLYKPPFGFPRNLNVPLVRATAANPYIFAVKRLIKEEVANNKWDIVSKDDSIKLDEQDQKDRLEIIDFLNNPNRNKEGWQDIAKACVNDICDLDSGIWIKVFNKAGKLVEVYARDGGSFLKNPDLFGSIGDRASIIYPDREMDIQSMNQESRLKYYDLKFSTRAAYWQYGWTNAALPVPFGKREIIYFMMNPKTDSVYGTSPVQILADVIYTLVYGSLYNLDFYRNSNIPEGIISLVGAQQNEVKAFKEKFQNSFTIKDPNTGFYRKQGFKVPMTSYPASFTPFQLSSRDMEIISQQQWFTKVVWMAFGLSADDMGFSEDSNKSTSESAERRYAKKAAKPLLKLFETRINKEILPEFGNDKLKFVFDKYDLDDEMKKYMLYKAQLEVGVTTPLMIAEEENIDVEKLRKFKAEEAATAQKEQAASGEKVENSAFKQDNGRQGKQNSGKPSEKDSKAQRDKKYIKKIKTSGGKIRYEYGKDTQRSGAVSE